MVGLVIKSPLADDEVSSAVLYPLDFLLEVVLLEFVQLVVVFSVGNLDLMLCLWLRWLKWTC